MPADGFLEGTLTALVTPFAAGRVDFGRLAEQVRYQVDHGVDGVVPAGTTGESPTLSHEEHRRVIETVVETARAAGRAVSVVAGTGSNSTAEAVETTRHARDAGADAALVVSPYYNKPTQEGLYRHFVEIAESVELPLVLYNIPSRTGVAMSIETIVRLAEHPRVVAIKEATGDLDVSSAIAQRCSLTILSGDDSLTVPIMSVGGRGVISVLSNLLPRRVRDLTDAMLREDVAEARAIHLELFPIVRAMFVESNPIPIKTAMALVGRDSGELRLPLCEPRPESRAAIEGVVDAVASAAR